MVFSLFNRYKKNRSPELKGEREDEREKKLSPRTRSGQTTLSRPAETLDEARRRQAEMTAKINAIESEMTAEFPALQHPTRKSKRVSVPPGVDLPPAVKHEPVQPPVNTPTVAMEQHNPPTFIATQVNPGTDICMEATDKMNAVEISPANQGTPPIVEEVAILFANGQYADCVRALRDELARDPSFAVVWLLLFEVFQQTANAKEFEALAIDYSARFETSPPCWRSPPSAENTETADVTYDMAEIVLPAQASAETMKNHQTVFARLIKSGLGAKLNFNKLVEADAEGAQCLRELLHDAQKNPLPLVMVGVTQAAFALRSKLVVGDRSQPENCWLVVLDFYRLLAWHQQFDDLAVDYAVTFEVSPPSYETPPKHIQIMGALSAAQTMGMKTLIEGSAPQMKGDVLGQAVEALAMLEAAEQAEPGTQVNIDCSLLGRVDFSAAGTLLTWLLGAHARSKHFVFLEVHPLAVALFEMLGINTAADVIARRS